MRTLQEVYCIHLKGSDDRKSHMDTFFRKLGLSAPLYWFQAINGSRVINPKPKKLSPGRIGCILSHLLLWDLISRKSDGFYMILEDDLGMVPPDGPLHFESELNKTLRGLPKNIQMLHCTLDKSKKFNYKKSKFENRYKVIGTFNDRPIKKCSLTYPWATLTGAYLITPSAARKMFLFAYYSIKLSNILPLKPKRYNIDILMSRSYIASHYGAMGIILKQNVPLQTSSQWVSDIKSVSENAPTRKDLFINRAFFKEAEQFVSPWKFAK